MEKNDEFFTYKVSKYLKNPSLFYKRLSCSVGQVKNNLSVARLRYLSIRRSEFINDIKFASENNIGYAAGKIGKSQQHWMYYEIVLKKEKDPAKVRQFEEALNFHGLKQEGVFPANPEFYLTFNKFYMEHIRNFDCIGICYLPEELELIRHYKLKNKMILYPYQEPDRSSPSDEKNCYLRYFAGKRILIICPFAGILMQRATKEIFEGVWSKTGKKWFYPSEVLALEFPYGFSRETHQRYHTAIDFFDYITAQIDKKDFDVALIGAGGLSIPIASHIKNMGKIAIDLGGHLQVLFGVLGKRWRDWEFWQRAYTNEWWIDMPDEYRPKEKGVCDLGAYW